MNHSHRLLWSFTLAMLAAGCGDGTDPITALKVSPSNAVVGHGRVYQLFASTLTQSGVIASVSASNSSDLKWSSSNPTIANVATDAVAAVPANSLPNDFSLGIVTGLSSGTANITATYNGLSNTVPIVVPTLDDVTAVPATTTTIALTLPARPTATLRIDGTYTNPTATIAITPAFNLTSSDTGVATVAAETSMVNGLSTPTGRFIVTGVGSGTATISGSLLTFSVSWTVTVAAP